MLMPMIPYGKKTALVSQTAKLLASDGAAGDNLGRFVAISGNYAIVSADLDDDVATSTGSAYIFERNVSTGEWLQKQKLLASDAAANDRFGWSIDMSGDYAIIGSYNGKCAYVFERNATTGVWTERAILAVSGVTGYFGHSVSISGSYAIVGGYGVNGSIGAVYVFERNATTEVWSLTSTLTPSDGVAGDEFGFSVSIDGNYVIVGSHCDDNNKGSAYIFERNATTGVWTQKQKLSISGGIAYDYFGQSVSISGSYAVVGAYGADVVSANFDDGAAYVYERNMSTGVWSQKQKLSAPGGGADSDYFGYAVSISGNRVVVGSCRSMKEANKTSYLFEKNSVTGSWGALTKFSTTDALGSVFDPAICISGNDIIIGAILRDDMGVDSGAAYIFQIAQ